ncbi:MAG: GNAT family N-acetyltransferase [Hyphomicrobiales bacterium]
MTSPSHSKKPHTLAPEIRVVSQFDFMSDDYKELFKQSNATIFQSPFWLDCLYRTLPDALNAEAVIVTVSDTKTGQLLMILPFVRQTKFGTKIMQPADLGITDYNTIIALPDVLVQLENQEGFDAQLKQALTPFDILLFRKQRPESFDISKLLSGMSRSANQNSAFEMEMVAPFEEWQRDTLSKSSRKGLARKRRNFDKEIGELTFKALTDAEEIKQAFVFLRDERGKRYPDDLLSKPAYFDFYLDVAINQAKSGKAVTYVGEANGQLITAEFGLYDEGRHIMLLGAYSSNEIYRKYSPGLQSIMDMMRTRKEQNIQFFDFSIGDEDYKESFGATYVPLYNMILTNGIKGLLAAYIYRDNAFIKKLIKKLSPNVH